MSVSELAGFLFPIAMSLAWLALEMRLYGRLCQMKKLAAVMNPENEDERNHDPRTKSY